MKGLRGLQIMSGLPREEDSIAIPLCAWEGKLPANWESAEVDEREGDIKNND
jgi:hypothetical protein